MDDSARTGAVRRSTVFAVIASGMAFGSALPVQAMPGRPARSYPDAGAEGQMPGVVDRRGCIRLCDQDLAPCDPPTYKRADGRCTHDY